jgi:endonuclease YncB( thermonuclease family)
MVCRVLILSKVAFAVAVLALLMATLRIATSDIRTGRARAIDSDALIVNDLIIRLQGIRTFPRGTSCMRGGERWPCGDISEGALAALVDDRWLFCRLIEDKLTIIATCHAGLDDIARTLVRQGWAVADGNRYAAAQREAMLAGRGLWRWGTSVSDSRRLAATHRQQPSRAVR